MRRDSGPQLREPNGAFECCFDRRDRFAVELNEVLCVRIDPVPATQMREQARGDRNGRLALIRLRAPLFPAIIASALQVYVRATDRRDRRCGSNRPRPRTTVDAQQNKPSKMSKRTLAGGAHEALHLPPGR